MPNRGGYISGIKSANSALSAVGTFAKRAARGMKYLRGHGGSIKISRGRISGKTYKSKSTKQKVKRLSKNVRSLQKAVAAERSSYTMRDLETNRTVCGENAIAWRDVDLCSLDTLQSACASWRMYDAATNAPVTANPVTGTYSREIRISSYSRIVIRNNYNIAVKVDAYICVPKADTDQIPSSALTSGLVDQGGVALTVPSVQLTDSDVFNKLWRIVKKRSKLLLPGREMYLTHSTGEITYNGSVVDTHNLTFQQQLKAAVCIYRVEGVVAHDSGVTSEQGLAAAGVDHYHKRVWKAKYDSGGPKLNDFFVSNDLSSFTGSELSALADVRQSATFAIS